MGRAEASKFIKLFIPPIAIAVARKSRRREWHREVVGGMWDEIGRLQFEFLVGRGLKPEHRIVDIGCGSLRGGVHFVRYLNDGNYFGIDKNEQLLEAGLKIELPRYGLQYKTVHLLQTDTFDFSYWNTQFDYALALSLFTHLPLNSIIRCIMSVEKTLVVGGEFYATFFENPGGKLNLDPVCHQPGGIVSYFDRDPFHYDFATFMDICRGTSLKVDYIGEWNHPRGQAMMVFTKYGTEA